MAKHPWDRQHKEPVAAYVRFLVYRNLGPARSLDRAYSLASNRNESASGQWRKESSAWDWPARARAWDIAVLSESGRESVAMFIAAVNEVSRRLLLAALDPDIKIGDWSQVIETLNALGAHIPAELVQQAAGSAGGDRKPRLAAG